MSVLCLFAAQASSQPIVPGHTPAPISWLSTFASAGDFNHAKIVALPDDGAILLYHHRPHLLEPAAQSRLARVDATGNLIWQQTLPGTAKQIPNLAVADDAIIVAQHLEDSGVVGEGRFRSYRLADGALNWERSVPNLRLARVERTSPLAVSHAGQIVALSQTGGALVIMRFTLDGTPLPLRTWQGPGHTNVQPWDMALHSDGSAVIVASSEVAGQNQGVLIGIDSNGELEYADELDTPFQGEGELRVRTAASGDAYIIGKSTLLFGAGLAVMKYSRSGLRQWRRDAHIALGEFFPLGLAVDAQERPTVYMSLDNAPAFIGAYLTTFSSDGALVNARFPIWSNPTIGFGHAMTMRADGWTLTSSAPESSANASFELMQWRPEGTPCTRWRIGVAGDQYIQPLATTVSASGDWLFAAVTGVTGDPDGYSVALWKIAAAGSCNLEELNQLGFEEPAYFLPLLMHGPKLQ